MRHGQLVVVGVQAEEGEIRMHHPDIDPVEGEVVDDHFGVALGHAAAGLAVAGDRPPFEAGRVQSPEDPGPALDERLYLEVVLPDAPVPQMLGQPGDEQIGRFENVPIGRNDKLFLRHDRDLPAWGRATHYRTQDGRGAPALPCSESVDQPVGTGNAGRRWTRTTTRRR